MGDTSRSQTISTVLQQIAGQAAKYPDTVFTTLIHKIDVDFLREAYRRIRKNSAPGVDGITSEDYAVNLEENLLNLYQRLKSESYKAPPVARVWIDKDKNKKRPIGLPTFEDKIVQRAVEMLLSPIYDQMFCDFSHGFRRGHSQHQAIDELRNSCRKGKVKWILCADITGLFDNIDHEILLNIVKRKINDGGIIRMIGKWLNAGVMENGVITYGDKGTPQGGVISPLMSNIFLHYILDEWYVKDVVPRMAGNCFISRWADDFIIGFEYESDAQRVMKVISKRFEKFKLNLHPEKTRLILFRKPSPANQNGKGNQTFTYLGFTFYWKRSRQGWWIIGKKTSKKSLSKFMKMLWEWCKEERHTPIEEQHKTLCSKLRGYYQYFGVIGNYKLLEVVYEYALKAWRRWLSRRSHKGKVLFDYLQNNFPFPKPRIVHNI